MKLSFNDKYWQYFATPTLKRSITTAIFGKIMSFDAILTTKFAFLRSKFDFGQNLATKTVNYSFLRYVLHIIHLGMARFLKQPS